jgi:hypothetical protein
VAAHGRRRPGADAGDGASLEVAGAERPEEAASLGLEEAGAGAGREWWRRRAAACGSRGVCVDSGAREWADVGIISAKIH